MRKRKAKTNPPPLYCFRFLGESGHLADLEGDSMQISGDFCEVYRNSAWIGAVASGHVITMFKTPVPQKQSPKKKS